MAELSIDQSKLPGVKEVCRDFAVLEDHTLAHNLQEQEIEHHLATNVQRNRLVQHDLQMAKQLQEEEDLKARTRIQERHKDMERQDCEIAQEIQVKLVIEAEQRRRQEEDDEGIARFLQQKELQEEKRRKKPLPDPLQPATFEEGNRDPSCSSTREQALEPTKPGRPRSRDRQPRQQRERQRGPPLVSEGLDLEVLGSSSEVKKAKHSRKHGRENQEMKPRSLEKPKGVSLDAEDDLVERSNHRGKGSRERTSAMQERTRRPPSVPMDGEPEGPGWGHREGRERSPRSHEGLQRLPVLLVDSDQEDDRVSLDHKGRRHGPRERSSSSLEKYGSPQRLSANVEGRHPERRYGNSCSPTPGRHGRLLHEDQNGPRPPSRDPRAHGPEVSGRRGHRRHAERESEGAVGRTRASPSSQRGAGGDLDTRRHQNPGPKSRATKEALYQKPRPATAQDQELYDAEIARRLQEEELLASQVDRRAAQVAQDEEIARLLLEEEKKAYRKAREREKLPSERKRQDQDWKHDPHELGRPRSREGNETHRSRSDKPARPPPLPSEDLDHLCSLTSQNNLAPQISKPEPSHKGYHYKQ